MVERESPFNGSSSQSPPKPARQKMPGPGPHMIYALGTGQALMHVFDGRFGPHHCVIYAINAFFGPDIGCFSEWLTSTLGLGRVLGSSVETWIHDPFYYALILGFPLSLLYSWVSRIILQKGLLDSFSGGGKTWAIHLAAVTCLSLAAKIDEVNVPNTVNLQAGEPKFLFEGKTIKRMEILVLNYLKWHTKPHTPLNFVEYFLKRMNDDIETPQGPLITRSIQIILSTIKGIDFLEFKPSELAAAVAVFVSSEKRAMDIDKALSSFLIIEKGRVMKCLELIQDLISTCGTTCSSLSTTTTLTTNMANGSILSSSFCCSPNGVLDAACLSYKSDERKVGSSCPSSSETSPDKKRRKLANGRYLMVERTEMTSVDNRRTIDTNNFVNHLHKRVERICP
ncbi:hypothetical protein CASFOL_038922 [Castilleja foliolosa]|uniref:B-like cyclin n=1 Tax=Castilleja foliolosa TaxID=1961234 RepID=A0ABD3BIA3_9LAMI